MAIRLYKPSLVSLLALSTVLLGHATITRAQRFTVFDAPDASGTGVTAINARGEVAGTFRDTTQANKPRGFVRDVKGTGILRSSTPQMRS